MEELSEAFTAAKTGDLATFSTYLGAHPNELNSNISEFTFLGYASLGGHVEIVKYLLEKSEIAVNNGSLEDFSSPLDLACREGHLEVVQELLEHPNIDVNSFRVTMKEISYSAASLDKQAMLGAMLCKKGNFSPCEHLDEIEDEELITKIRDKLAPKKSARN
mmetsp:Transcript_113629/g.169961  ORF Transcript_113629/g.169961 Transcript_113629/m.169961 type:complete len:162 (-) Transcript_113629:30-515(-)